jgi:putative ABC transport system ATP-binding protein
VIELRGIGRDFSVGGQTVRALHDVDLSVAAGEYLSIMGPSGSGKSTLLNVIGLLDQPSRGSYHLDGVDVTGFDDTAQAVVRRDKIGFVFQFFHLVPRLTAAENVALPLVLAGIDPEQRRARVAGALAALGLAERAEHRPEQLSGGQRQRVAIARATVTGPRVLLADEPTGNLDRQAGKEVIDLLESLHDAGLTLLVVTHDPEIGLRAGRRIRVVDGGIDSDERAP